MNKPLVQSVVFHVVVAVILILSGLELFGRSKPDLDLKPITVELAPIGDKTNLKAAPRQQEPKPAVKPQPKPEPQPKKPEPKKPEPKKPEPKPEAKPEPKKPDPKKEPEKKPVKKEPEKKPATSELDSLLKTLDDPDSAPAPSSNQENTDPNSRSDTEFDSNAPMTVSELDYIRNLIMKQIIPCWNVPVGAVDAGNLIVSIDVDIERDGTMKFVGFADSATYSSDAYYRVAADAARRAVQDPRCNPLQELPPMDKFSQWHELSLAFNPKDLIY